jgi:hypothetical protein
MSFRTFFGDRRKVVRLFTGKTPGALILCHCTEAEVARKSAATISLMMRFRL